MYVHVTVCEKLHTQVLKVWNGTIQESGELVKNLNHIQVMYFQKLMYFLWFPKTQIRALFILCFLSSFLPSFLPSFRSPSHHSLPSFLLFSLPPSFPSFLPSFCSPSHHSLPSFLPSFLYVSQNLRVLCFSWLSLCSVIQILVGECIGYIDPSYVFQPLFF